MLIVLVDLSDKLYNELEGNFFVKMF